ncbi:MAG: carboxypeptidase-like regulatory domain-containing protein [Acidobacteria bacterium]|nr:carboxypeptidase-like regulatory domain-containing protein [Acidobacteriota bacterium]
MIRRTTAITIVNPLVLVPVLAILLGVPVLSTGATIEGQISNGTTNQPLTRQKVQLISPQGGMLVVGEATTDAHGRFTFNNDQINPRGFYLLQATYEGVDYNAPVKFNSNGNSFSKIRVYESTHKKPALRVSSARIIIRAVGSQAHVQELYALDNPLDETYSNSQGTFFFHVSPKIGTPMVAAVGLMNMPLPQNPVKGKSPGDFHIDYALRPGMNVMMVAYNTDYTGNNFTLADSIPYPIGRAELFVFPPDLTVTSNLFTPAGKDAESGSQRLVAQDLAPGAQFAAQVAGQAAPPSAQQASSNQEEPQVKVVPDSVSAVGVPLLLCFLLALLWALGIRVAKEFPRWKAKQHGSPVQKKFQAKMETILNSIADLDELFSSGKIAEKQYWKERLELKAKAVAILKKEPSAKPSPVASRKASR